MDPREMDMLLQRLVANPHDEDALARAHHAGANDPRSYALLLERVGQTTTDPSYAAHWLSEAASVWSMTIGDLHHAARTLMIAIDKDPTSTTAAERLAQLYRDQGDQRALAALLERMVKALSPRLAQNPDLQADLLRMYEELGKLWMAPPLSKPERAAENFKRMAELDRENVLGIYQAREALKGAEFWADAIPFFAMEQAQVDDPERKIALYRDESKVREKANDLKGASEALRQARAVRPDDYALVQELATSILVRVEAGESVPEGEKEEGRGLFLSLAEAYDGEYGFSYAVSALKVAPGDDRAMQLADHYGKQIGKTGELTSRFAAYLAANPNGFMAAEARAKVGSRPPPPPAPAASSKQKAFMSEPTGPASPAFLGAAAQSLVSAGRKSAPAIADDDSEEVEPDEMSPAPGHAEELAVVNPAEVRALIDQAQVEVQKGRKPTALAKFRDALKLEPANSEALTWVEEHLRQKRMYSDLKDVLLAASRVASQSLETRKAQLRDVAGLCEAQLRDMETAISCAKQIVQLDRGDDAAREQLRRLLEKGSRWDDLAALIEQEAMSAPDTETKITLEKKLATLHESKRKDVSAAAESWARIAQISSGDETAIQTAVKLFEKANQFDAAAEVIAENVSGIDDRPTKGSLLQRLGELRAKAGNPGAAGEAYVEAAECLGPDGGSQTSKLWDAAEKAFTEALRFAEAANAVVERSTFTDGKPKAELLSRAASLFEKASDLDSAIEKLEESCELDPTHQENSGKLEALYRGADRMSDLATFLTNLAEKITAKDLRVTTRFKTVEVQQGLGDSEGARATLLLILNDGEDVRALSLLVDDAAQRDDHTESAALIHRLILVTPDKTEKLALAKREAGLYANEIDDPQAAIESYEAILKTYDANDREAIHAIGELHEKLGNEREQAAALERELAMTPLDPEDPSVRVELAQKLAGLYEGPLDDPKAGIRVLEIVHQADEEDFDAVARLLKLYETIEDWENSARLLAMLIEVEGDENEASDMSRKLATLQHDKLKRGDEALATLERIADTGDLPCQEAYVALGDELGWQGIVATKLVMWNEAATGPKRNEALRGAFDRFVAIGRDGDAARVAMELAKARAADKELGAKLEAIAVKTRDLDALGVAQEILAKEYSGGARAEEMVRQAEVLVQAGADPIEAIQHGESSLAGLSPADVEPLLARLAALTTDPAAAIDLYERQVARSKQPADRLNALARAALVAASKDATDRAKGFFEIALGGNVQDETLNALEDAAREADVANNTTTLRWILAESFSAGGQGSRDGGRTRSSLLRRAASLAERDLASLDKAFQWLGDGLVAFVDEAGLAALDELGQRAGDKKRVEATIGRALEEVFDGPLVRKLLAKRAKLRRDELGDREGAAVDLKKLHDLSPSDAEVMTDLSTLLEQLGDHRGMIHLYEDQILRGRDPAQRAELARKVARLWEEEIGDARESADAWRRVLRMKAADPEATAGLERAKTGNLKKAPPVYERPASMRPSMPSIPPGSNPPPPKKAEQSLHDTGEITADALPAQLDGSAIVSLGSSDAARAAQADAQPVDTSAAVRTPSFAPAGSGPALPIQLPPLPKPFVADTPRESGWDASSLGVDEAPHTAPDPASYQPHLQQPPSYADYAQTPTPSQIAPVEYQSHDPNAAYYSTQQEMPAQPAYDPAHYPAQQTYPQQGQAYPQQGQAYPQQGYDPAQYPQQGQHADPYQQHYQQQPQYSEHYQQQPGAQTPGAPPVVPHYEAQPGAQYPAPPPMPHAAPTPDDVSDIDESELFEEDPKRH